MDKDTSAPLFPLYTNYGKNIPGNAFQFPSGKADLQHNKLYISDNYL